jgi:hypothetical protein
MVAAERGLITVFNSTVYPSTFQEIPAVVRWGLENIDRVHGLVFITYRTFATDTGAIVDSAGQQMDAAQLGYSSDHFDAEFVTTPEVYQIIKDHLPEYEASAYLGGTVRHDSFKWLAGAVLGSKNAPYGSIGKKTMELAQVGHHLFYGTYLAYVSQTQIAPLAFLMSPWDKTVRQAARRWLADVLRHPQRLFDRIRVQTIGVIQAPDAQPNGQVDMCDSCPDMTVWEGNLINSCRMDEYRLFGGLLTPVERAKVESEPEPVLTRGGEGSSLGSE